MDKFTKYYSDPKKVEEMSDYVHLNFRLIMTKMVSEMRRKLDVKPDKENSEGYMSLLASLQARLMNEMVYSMAGLCQTLNMKLTDILPPMTLIWILEMMKGVNPLNDALRQDGVDLDTFNKYYLENIEQLRKDVEALPK
jgi:hypothetical protein